MIRSAAAVPVCFLSAVCLCRGDYLDDNGYRALAAELGAALPTGKGVGVTQVEAGEPDYLPQAGSGTFTAEGYYLGGVTLTARSGASGLSSHSQDVAIHFYGRNQNPAFGRVTLTPGIGEADVYHVGDDDGSDTGSWLGDAFLVPGSGPPLIETRAVQNHSWISGDSAASFSASNALLRRFDFAIQRDGFLAVTGVNNGGATAVPALMASAYNNLAVGVSTGAHSRGGVVAQLDGGGRQKPEIVAPMDYTSFSTAMVSSAAALLRQTAETQGVNARRPRTIKAVLLAGAVKEALPGWSRTETAPLDKIYGAGELHIGNSWHILAGGEQAADGAAPAPDRAWSQVTLMPSGKADFKMVIPPGETGTVFSAVAVWERMVTDSNPGSGFTASVAPLADYNLVFERVPAAGKAVTVDRSASAIENVEHLYQRNLPSGVYRLRVTLASGVNSPAAVAWRLHRTPHRPGISLERGTDGDTLTFSGLIPGQRYLIQNSPDLNDWAVAEDFTAAGDSRVWKTAAAAGRWFYRLAAADEGVVPPAG